MRISMTVLCLQCQHNKLSGLRPKEIDECPGTRIRILIIAS